uniref:Exonuclease domain-containing protein n=1 Tax=Heligmosomoides polygyrus TaxID=6339 RepID=A0A183GNJ4_HELPZ
LNFGEVSMCVGYNALLDFFPRQEIRPNDQCDDRFCRQRQKEYQARKASEVTVEMPSAAEVQVVHEENNWGIAAAQRQFISKYMARLDSHLHYRIVDVSTVKELASRWFPEEYAKAPVKKSTHRALDDIRESIEELRYYPSVIFRDKNSGDS